MRWIFLAWEVLPLIREAERREAIKPLYHAGLGTANDASSDRHESQIPLDASQKFGVQRHEAVRRPVLTTESTSPARAARHGRLDPVCTSRRESGIESVLLSFSRYEPGEDTILIALVRSDRRRRNEIHRRLPHGPHAVDNVRAARESFPLAGLIGGRVALNVVAGSSTENGTVTVTFSNTTSGISRRGISGNPVTPSGAMKARLISRRETLPGRAGKLHAVLAPGQNRSRNLCVRTLRAGAAAGSARGSVWFTSGRRAGEAPSLVSIFENKGLRVSLRLCVICRSTHEKPSGTGAILPDEEISKRARHS